MTFSEKLKEARKQAGLSQEQLAEQLHISRSAIAKWEAGLGIPDVENLKALSLLLNLSMDDLLDDTQTLDDVRSNQPDADTCCGKSCEGCSYRKNLNCPGCRKLDHHGIDGCAIARCCQGKRLDSCKNCNCLETCSILRGRDYVPTKRRTALNTHNAKEKLLSDRRTAYASWLVRSYPTLHKWMPKLFGVYLLPVAAGLLGLLPALTKPAALLGALLPAVFAVLLFMLSPVHPNYKKASILCLASAAVAVIAVFYPDVDGASAALQDGLANSANNLSQLLQDYEIAQLISSAIDCVSGLLLFGAAYFEYHAHADILAPFHKKRSRQWMQLWKAERMITGGTLALVASTLALPFLAALLVWILVPLSFGSIGLTVYRCILLFRLSKFFRTTTAEDLMRSADLNASLPS